MQISSIPAKIYAAFANASSALKQTVPIAPASGAPANFASFNTGFPAITAQNVETQGGIPPDIKDFNGIFNQITAVQLWQCAGGGFGFDANMVSNQGGYPKGAMLQKAAGIGYWISLVDNNTVNPDSAQSSQWADFDGIYYCAENGSANLYTCTCPVSIPFLYDGLKLRFKATHANTGAAQISVNGLAANSLLINPGNSLQGGEIFNGAICEIVYNAPFAAWHLISASVTTETNDANAAANNNSPVSSNWIRAILLNVGGAFQTAVANVIAAVATAAGFSYVSGTNGHLKYPSWLGGKLIQWGIVTASSTGGVSQNVDVTFPVQFNNTCESFGATCGVATYNLNINNYRNAIAYVNYALPTQNGCQGQLTITSSDPGNTRCIQWTATGY